MTQPAVPTGQPVRVLIIEDDPDDVLLLREDLSAGVSRIQAEVVPTLDAALRRLDIGGIDVALTDLTLPDSSGLDTFHALAAHPAKIPIIVLSGLEDEALALQTVELGAQDYLVKGQVDHRLLVRALRYAIKRAEAERALATERNLLRSVIDNLVDAIYVKDREGRYLLSNIAHARQLGFHSPDEIIGKHTYDIFSEETANAFLTDDEAVRRSGEPVINRHECVVEQGRMPHWLSTTKVPLRNASSEVVGIVGIGRDITARKLSEEKLARYTQELQEKNAELEEDLNMAREVQMAFLPQQFPSFPPHRDPAESSIQFCSEYLPTTALGGDFFHVIPLSDSEAGVLICDVMGHGVRAALVTAVNRALVEELTPYASDPGAFLAQMNHELFSILRRTRSPLFASAFYVIVNTATGEITFANAGHPRPLQIRRSAGEVSLLEPSHRRRAGPAMGLFENSTYETIRGSVRPGDALILFTDGLYEVEDAAGELYDQNLLLEAVARQKELPTRQLIRAVLNEVRGFSGSGTFLDDVCVVGIEICRVADSSDHCVGEESALAVAGSDDYRSP